VKLLCNEADAFVDRSNVFYFFIVHQCAFQVVDHRQKAFDDLRTGHVENFCFLTGGTLAKIIELRIKAQVFVIQHGDLLFQLSNAFFGPLCRNIGQIVLFGPLLFPIARQAGVHEVHYAMVVILAMGIGLFSPPFGVGYYGACAISKISPDEGLKQIWGYIAALFFGLAVVAAVPWLSTGFLKF